MNSTPGPERRRAVVIGASMAGLLAGRVLSDYYTRVTIVERDTLPAAHENRRGVPQGRHTHGLLASGKEVLEAMFPSIADEMMAAGAVCGDIVRDARWFHEGGCHCRFESGLTGVLASRPFLEGIVRKRVRALPNVEFRENQDVTNLVWSADGSRVTGAVIGPEPVDAELVVDGSGRGSRTTQWLQAKGYPAPDEERVEIGLSYTTRLFRRDASHLDGDLAAIIPPTPEGKRGGVMLAQEDSRWTVTLISHFGPGAPPELPGFVEYAGTLPASFIYDVIRRAEPASAPAVAKFPASTRRRYERLNRFPEGYLVVGDALSSFNPIYGQGMSVAALEATELKLALAGGNDRLARRFFARAAEVVDIPWSISAGNDLRMAEARGPRTPAVKIINAYMARLHRAAHRDPAVAMAFHRVANLLAPPPSVMHPRIAWRVLRGNMRGGVRPQPRIIPPNSGGTFS